MSIWKVFRDRPKIKQRKIVTIEESIKKIRGSGLVVVPPENEKIRVIKPLDLMKVKYLETPNKSLRKDEVKYLVLHHTGYGSHKGITNWLTNKQAKVSAHYVVGVNGKITQLFLSC